MTMMKLQFQMNLASARSPISLIEGKLDVIDGNQVTHTFVATSGMPGFQTSDDQSAIARGPIPSCEKAGLSCFWVSTEPYYSPTADSYFFHITPDPVRIEDVFRGEFGILLDTGFPGSSGCIVLRNPQEWNDFQQFMKECRDRGKSSLPLLVNYPEQLYFN